MNRIEQSDLRMGYQSICPRSGQEQDSCSVVAYELATTLIAMARGRTPGTGKTAADAAVSSLVEVFDAAQTADIPALLADGLSLIHI